MVSYTVVVFYFVCAKLFKLLENVMRISSKLSLGFGGVLALLLVLAGTAFWALTGSNEGFSRYRSLARQANLSGRAQANMLLVRMSAKDFIITGSDEVVEKYDGYFTKMIEFLTTAKTEIKEPKKAELINNALAKSKSYGRNFTKVKEFRAKRNHYVNDILNVQGPQMEHNLTKILTTAKRDDDMDAAYRSALALRSLLLARLYVVKFLDDNSPGSKDRVHKEIKALSREFAILDDNLQNSERRRLLEELLELEKTYSGAFESLTNVIFKRNDVITNSLDKLGPEVAEEIEAVKLSIIAAQDVLGPEVQASNNQAIVMSLIITIVALFIGVGAAWILIRGIIKPLTQSVYFAQRVASGDLTVTIANDSNDEIGMLIQSLRNMASRITTAVFSIREGSSNVSEGSAELSASAQTLSQGATEQAASIEEVSSAIEQMASNIQQNTENAQKIGRAHV